MEYAFQFAIAVGILVAQYFISRRGPVWVGAILPIIYLGGLVYGLFTQHFNGSLKSILVAGIGGTVLLISAWIKGRESLAKKRQRELNKIKAMDL
jgi:ATP/ADP translocase